MPDRLNVLLITTDTSRVDTLAVSTIQRLRARHLTHLDRLASEGVIFDQAPHPGDGGACRRAAAYSPGRTAGARASKTESRGATVHAFQTSGRRRLSEHHGGQTHFGPVPESFHVQHVLRREVRESDDFYGRHLRAHGFAAPTSHPNPVPEELFCDAFLVDTRSRRSTARERG